MPQPVLGASVRPGRNGQHRLKPNKTRKIATDKAVVLENAAFGYTRPNILDAKLGSRLWADDAPLEKKQRFDKIASETTSGSLEFSHRRDEGCTKARTTQPSWTMSSTRSSTRTTAEKCQ